MGDSDQKYRKLFDICANAKDDRIALSQLIVSEGLNPTAYDVTTDQGKTPLHIAASHGNLDIVQTLVEVYGCSPNVMDGIGSKPVHHACLSGHLSTVDYLLYVNVDVKIDKKVVIQRIVETDWKGNTLLHCACRSGSVALTRYITHVFLTPDSRFKLNLYKDDFFPYVLSNDSYGNLCVACTHSEEYRCTFKEYVLMENKVNDTPLHTACRHGHLVILKFFFQLCTLCGFKEGLWTLIPIFERIACQINNLPLVHFFCSSLHSISMLQTAGTVKHRVMRCKESTKILGKCKFCHRLHSNTFDNVIHADKLYAHSNDLLMRVSDIELALLKGTRRGDYAVAYSFVERVAYGKYHHNVSNGVYVTEREKCLLLAARNQDLIKAEYLLKSIIQLTSSESKERKHFESVCSHDVEVRKKGILLNASYCGNLELVKYAIEILTVDDEHKISFHTACKLDNVELVEYLFQNSVAEDTDSDGNSPLHIACQWGSLNTVNYLLKVRQCKPNECNNKNETPLHLAVKYHRYNVFLVLIDIIDTQCISFKNSETQETILHLASSDISGVFVKSLAGTTFTFDLDAADRYGDSPLFNACRSGNTEMVTLLIQMGCNPFYVNEITRETPVYVACRMQRLEILQNLLLGIQTIIRGYNLLKETPLSLAFCNDSTGIVEFLFNNDYCDVNQWLTKTMPSPLHVACSRGLLKVAEILLYKCASCDKVDNNGNTALHIACNGHSLDVIELLVKHSSLTAQNKEGNTPLHLVCSKKWLAALRCMLSQYTSGSLDSFRNETGSTVLHVATEVQCPEMVKLLLSHCSIQIVNNEGNTPVHIACQLQNVLLVECMIIKRSDCPSLSLDAFVTKHGDTPLHIAAKNGSLDIIKLLREHHCSAVKANKDGDTPIHVACQFNHVSAVEYLVGCNLENGELLCTNRRQNTLLHTACEHSSLDIVKLLVDKGCQFDTNKAGDTPFHIACRLGRMDIAEYIATSTSCDIYQFNSNGESALYCALKCKQKKLVKTFIEKRYCDPSKEYFDDNQYKLPLLHCLVTEPKLVFVLLKQDHCDVNIVDGVGNTLLHHVCKDGMFSLATSVLLHLTKFKEDFDLNRANHEGNTVLHLACEKTHDVRSDPVLHRCPNCRRRYLKKGTPSASVVNDVCSRCKSMGLQYYLRGAFVDDYDYQSARYETEYYDQLYSFEVQQQHARDFVQKLVFTGKVTQSVMLYNKQQKTPVQLTNNYSVIRLLISYGANPQDVYEIFGSVLERYKLKQPLEQFPKLVVIGNSSAGKTTLVTALKASESKVTDTIQCVDGPTAGIVQSSYVSECYGRVVFHDFAGQPEFESTNSAFLETQCSSPSVQPPIFLLLVDMKEAQSIHKNVLYWLTFIENHCSSQAGTLPHVIIIGSHADLVPSVEESRSILFRIIQKFKSSSNSLSCYGPVLLDCRKPGTDEIKSLQSLLKDSCTSLSKSIELDCRCHILFTHLLEWFPKVSAVKFRELENKIQLFNEGRKTVILYRSGRRRTKYLTSNYDSQAVTESGPDLLLPVASDVLLDILNSLHTAGHILLLKGAENTEDYWIVMDQDSLFSDVNGTLFAPDDFPQHLELNNNTGVFPSAKIKELFPKLDPNMVQQFLVYSEFCQRVTDIETLNLISLGSDHNPDCAKPSVSNDKYLFFPGLIKSDKPGRVWSVPAYQNIGYQCGWILQCKPENFLETRFLHVLLLRLTFSFVSAANTSESGEKTLNRKCDLWKNGIHWSTRNGVEVLVEVVKQNTLVIVLIRCWEHQEMEAVKLRSAVLSKIIATKQQFCSKVDHDEYLIHCASPTGAIIDHNKIDSYCRIHITEIAQAVSEGLPCIIDSNNKPVPLDSLLFFEPYSRLGKELIALLFAEENSTKDIPQETLYDLADLLHPVHKQVTQVLKVPQRESSIHMKTWKDNPTILLHHIFESWKSRQASSTYETLRQQFDEYSTFFGRNPLEMCGMPIHNV